MQMIYANCFKICRLIFEFIEKIDSVFKKNPNKNIDFFKNRC